MVSKYPHCVLWLYQKARVWRTNSQTDGQRDRWTDGQNYDPKTVLAQLRRALKKLVKLAVSESTLALMPFFHKKCKPTVKLHRMEDKILATVLLVISNLQARDCCRPFIRKQFLRLTKGQKGDKHTVWQSIDSFEIHVADNNGNLWQTWSIARWHYDDDDGAVAESISF